MFAIRAARCFDGDSFRQGGATVLIEGQQIAGVEPFGYEVPVGCEVTSYDGTVLPGLFDCHVHLVADGSPGSLERAGLATDDEVDSAITGSLVQQARAGVTSVRDLGDARYRTLGIRDRRAPGIPRIVAAGPPITETRGHCHFLGGEAEGADAVRASVAEHVERGVDVLKVMASGGLLTPGTDPLGCSSPPRTCGRSSKRGTTPACACWPTATPRQARGMRWLRESTGWSTSPASPSMAPRRQGT